MARIPERSMLATPNQVAGAFPTINLSAPGPTVFWVADRVQTRLVNVGGGTFQATIRISDPVAGGLFVWRLGSAAPAGTLDVAEFDQDNLGINITPGQPFTVEWLTAVPAGSVGNLAITFHLAG